MNYDRCGLRYARSRAKKDGGAAGAGQNRKKKADKVDEKLNHHHIVGGNGSANGVDVKRGIRQRNRDSASGAMTPPLATIAAAGGSPGYATTMLRRSFGSGSEYGAPGTSPGGSISESDGGQHGHGHYAVLAAGNVGAAVGGSSNGNESVLTPSPSPPASTSVPSASASGSLALPLSGGSPTTSTPPSASTPHPDSNQDIGFIHYNPPARQPDRAIPPLNIHSYPQPHPLRSPQASSTHSHSPHSAFSGHPPGSTGPGHYVHTGYTTRPSPLSQAGNIVTGPAAGPLTPLSVPHSATEATDDGIGMGPGAGAGSGSGVGAGNGMQLPPLAYMDRIMGSSPNNNMHASLGSMSGGVKLEYGDDGLSGQVQNGGGSAGMGGGGGSGSSVGREPLTPISAESPIGPGVAGGSMRSGKRSILGGQ